MNRCVVPLPLDHQRPVVVTVRRSAALLSLSVAFAAGALVAATLFVLVLIRS